MPKIYILFILYYKTHIIKQQIYLQLVNWSLIIRLLVYTAIFSFGPRVHVTYNTKDLYRLSKYEYSKTSA